ncbi:MAG: glycosyltransferase [Candidatus Puniceispirillum sp.]|jgi:colanic acid/amylovoran biosynthesis glycosyltransferase|uniref:glycosyltransferase n=1 Tax=Candidatus Puniceispirillum sp. TaxID=2026719 RepID=UPI001EBE8837|nr:glycosyltransferase [Candidatus Puniceispirillum sp.]MBT6415368.1 glycosyltransferase [Candidatus Puniceispirillum sp.]
MPIDVKKNVGGKTCLVFRDKLLLPSEGFIKSHYMSFDRLNPVYLANKIGWRADELEGAKHLTARTMLGASIFKQTGFSLSYKSLEALRPQVLHAHFGRGGALALPVAQRLNIPLYVTYHGGDATKFTHERKRFLPTIYQRRLAALQAYANGFLCVSDFVAKRLEAQGFPKHKLVTHYIGIDLADMQPPTPREGRLLFIGRLVGKKGVNVLLTAMRALHQSGETGIVKGLDIAGTGPDADHLREMAIGIPNISFLGWQTPEQLALRMRSCSAVVVPSHQAPNGDCEGLPTVILEAIRAGCPVIASNHAGIPEIINDNVSGILALENDSDSLVTALRRFASMADVPAMVAKAQRRLRAEFDAATQSAKLQGMLASHYAPTKPPNLFA